MDLGRPTADARCGSEGPLAWPSELHASRPSFTQWAADIETLYPPMVTPIRACSMRS